MHQIGIENVVASSGTSLTTEQIRLVKRYTKNITMLYDGDAAGVHAALRGTDMILAEGMNVRVVVLPPEHDPDTFGKEYPTEEVLRYLKDNAKDFIRFKTELLLKDAANDPIKKGQVVRNMVETISVVPDPIFRIAYVKETSRLLDMPEETLMMELNKMLRAKFKKSLGVEGEVIPDEPVVITPTQEQPQDETLPPGYYQERELVKLMLLYGGRTLTIKQQDELGQEVEEQVPVAQMIVDDLITDNIEFNDPVNRKIFEIYDQALNTEELPNDQFFTSNEDEQVSQVAIDLVTTQYKLDGWERHGIFVKKEEDILKKAVQYAILRYKDQIIDARRKEIQDQIKEEPDPDNQLILLKKKKHWDDLRVQINKMLGIVIAK
jgi:DNA primase